MSSRNFFKTRVHPDRIHILHDAPPQSGTVVYWMNRDQRVEDNWALLHAADLALDACVPLGVAYCFDPKQGLTLRQHEFSLRGLIEVREGLQKLNIPLIPFIGAPDRKLPQFLRGLNAGVVVTEFSPLRSHRNTVAELLRLTNYPVHEVDAHNIIPCRVVSQKQEFSARTIRPRINRLLTDFLTEFPFLRRHPVPMPQKLLDAVCRSVKLEEVLSWKHVDRRVAPIKWIHPGERAARRRLRDFIRTKLPTYHLHRNDPTKDNQSVLSPYLHFGHISAHRVALEVGKAEAPEESKAAFLEELIVRRELSDNYCFYNQQYDQFDGFPVWARKSLNDHRCDIRAPVYDEHTLESGETADSLWNAAQRQMITTGKMHGYMRMYWAKKILEWSPNPEAALRRAIVLNDRYSLDGNDPNGYAGIAWSIGGVHDRPWFDRPIFGKVRYMNDNGCRAKFDVQKYIDRYGD